MCRHELKYGLHTSLDDIPHYIESILLLAERHYEQIPILQAPINIAE